MIRLVSALIYLFMVVWGAVQFALYGEVDWLVLSLSGLVFWDTCFKRNNK